MTVFVPRPAPMRRLVSEWDRVRGGGPRPGRCVIVGGPAGAGKSRLVTEFLRGAAVPHVYLAAPGDDGAHPLETFVQAAATSDLPGRDRFRRAEPADWPAALRAVADAADAEPCAVVLDGADALLGADSGLRAALWQAWHQVLADRPVLFVLVGRDAASLRPLGGAAPDRTGGEGPGGADSATVLEVGLLGPAELGQVLRLDPMAAFDAYLVTGGHPELCARWPAAEPAPGAVAEMLTDSPSPLAISAELMLARRFGPGAPERAVLSAMGPAERSRSGVGRRAGLPPASLDRALKHLVDDGLVTVERPLSGKPSREARYRVTDPYLRWWLPLVGPRRDDLARGRPDLVAAGFAERWPAWRRAGIRIVVREAMHTLARAGQLPGTGAVGGYWTRFDEVRVDLVGTDRPDGSRAVTFVGAVTWADGEPFDHLHLGELIAARPRVPGATGATPLVAVAGAGCAVGDAVAAVLGPAELMTAWSP